MQFWNALLTQGEEEKVTNRHLKCSFQRFKVSDNTLNYKGPTSIKTQCALLILWSKPIVNKTNIQLS